MRGASRHLTQEISSETKRKEDNTKREKYLQRSKKEPQESENLLEEQGRTTRRTTEATALKKWGKIEKMTRSEVQNMN